MWTYLIKTVHKLKKGYFHLKYYKQKEFDVVNQLMIT